MDIWKLRGARQASYGIATEDPRWWWTLRESFGEVDLSREVGEGIEVVETILDDATSEEQHNALARWEDWPETWAEQDARRRADLEADDAE